MKAATIALQWMSVSRREEIPYFVSQLQSIKCNLNYLKLENGYGKPWPANTRWFYLFLFLPECRSRMCISCLWYLLEICRTLSERCLFWVCAYGTQSHPCYRKKTDAFDTSSKCPCRDGPLVCGVSWGAGERGLDPREADGWPRDPLTWAVVGGHAHGGDGGRAGRGVRSLPIPLDGWRWGYEVILWPSVLQQAAQRAVITWGRHGDSSPPDTGCSEHSNLWAISPVCGGDLRSLLFRHPG